jgi:hypothetical protein
MTILIEFRHMNEQIKTATGTFEVKTVPLSGDGVVDNKTVGRMSLHKEFTGDMTGSADGQMLSAMGALEGSAGYVAMDKVTATLEGKNGSFILQHSGTMAHGEQHLVIAVVPDSGTGELAGISGVFKIAIENNIHTYTFQYSLD